MTADVTITDMWTDAFVTLEIKLDGHRDPGEIERVIRAALKDAEEPMFVRKLEMSMLIQGTSSMAQDANLINPEEW